MTAPVPIVEYLQLGDDPHLVANECTRCGARYVERQNACAGCFGTSFTQVRIPSNGLVRTFTIVSYAAPGVPVPFIGAVVDCGGISVQTILINTPPDPDHVQFGMKVQLALYSLGTDSVGVEAIGFGFEPLVKVG